MSSDLKSLVGQTLDVKIEKLAVGGSGIARHRFLERDIVVFVPLTAPGDLAQIKISIVEKTFLTGELVKIIEPSPHRRTPPCVVADRCGGCTWQHVAYDEQVHQKETILTDLFKKYLKGIEYTLLPTVSGKNQLQYRNRIQLKRVNDQLGYFKKGTHEVVDIEECPIAEIEVSDQIASLKKTLPKSTELTKWEVRRTQGGQIESYKIGEKGEGLSFAQVNSEINAKLVDVVAKLCVDFKPNHITELYAGGGNFTFPISQLLPQTEIRAVELNSELTKHAVEVVKSKKLQKKVMFFTASCDSYVKTQSISGDLVLLDPPRSGCNPVVINQIAWAKPKQIIYVSCHPVNLARDVAKIMSIEPQYKIQKLQIFDMFPQTDHFETLCVLTL